MSIRQPNMRAANAEVPRSVPEPEGSGTRNREACIGQGTIVSAGQTYPGGGASNALADRRQFCIQLQLMGVRQRRFLQALLREDPARSQLLRQPPACFRP